MPKFFGDFSLEDRAEVCPFCALFRVSSTLWAGMLAECVWSSCIAPNQRCKIDLTVALHLNVAVDGCTTAYGSAAPHAKAPIDFDMVPCGGLGLMVAIDAVTQLILGWVMLMSEINLPNLKRTVHHD